MPGKLLGMLNPWLILFWLLSLSAAGLGGWSLRGDHEDAKRLEHIVQTDDKKQADQNAVDQLDGRQSATNAAQAVKDRIITREVIRYVDLTPAADRCDLPGAWRLHHDAAASGQPAEPSGLADRDAASVTDAAAIATVSENYIACRESIRQVAGWQAWWANVKGSGHE